MGMPATENRMIKKTVEHPEKYDNNSNMMTIEAAASMHKLEDAKHEDVLIALKTRQGHELRTNYWGKRSEYSLAKPNEST